MRAPPLISTELKPFSSFAVSAVAEIRGGCHLGSVGPQPRSNQRPHWVTFGELPAPRECGTAPTGTLRMSPPVTGGLFFEMGDRERDWMRRRASHNALNWKTLFRSPILRLFAEANSLGQLIVLLARTNRHKPTWLVSHLVHRHVALKDNDLRSGNQIQENTFYGIGT